MRQDLPIPVVVPSHYLGLGCGFSPRFVRVSGSFFDGERARTLELSGNTKPSEGLPLAKRLGVKP